MLDWAPTRDQNGIREFKLDCDGVFADASDTPSKLDVNKEVGVRAKLLTDRNVEDLCLVLRLFNQKFL